VFVQNEEGTGGECLEVILRREGLEEIFGGVCVYWEARVLESEN